MSMDCPTLAIVVGFLLSSILDMPATGQVLDVCATCHANATCDNKSDGSGKVCNCMYGFVGNGRTYCQDKDECQIGASKICGPHTSCHNTYGSYYCRCLSGYTPTNNMNVFIPNDGTHCGDVDECRMPWVCGEGGRCTNLDGGFECRCQVGFRVDQGTEPFHPRDKASCKVIDCGQPQPVEEDTVLLSATGTTYGSVATFGCDDGFRWSRGDNSSVCGSNGSWKGPTLVCEEVECGPPPAIPHSKILWNKTSKMGSVVVYQCNSGYRNVGGTNISTCAPTGQWEQASVLCEEVLCGSPPVIESTEQVWNGSSTPGSTVLYHCEKGFYNKGGNNLLAVCNESGYWTQPTLSCQEILCGDPPILPHTGQVWNGSCTPGASVSYYCKLGFYNEEGNGISLCSINGYWTKPNISCKEVVCGGEPPAISNSVMMWDENISVGSQVFYQCISGYRSTGEGNVSICSASGEWDLASMLCEEITCGDPVFKPHAKVLWNNKSHIDSVVYYQCDEGHYTTSVKNYSVCGKDGFWEDIDLCCKEISCGSPLTLPHTKLLWDHSSRPGSVVLYECMDGFYHESGHNISTCSLSGKWGEVSIQCKAKCGPAPFLANSEVVCHNRSVVVHRCVRGYHSWRGSNISVCGSSGKWQEATLRCIEVKPAINDLIVFDEKCLRWKAEKYDEDTEDYTVIYVGSRDFQSSFLDKRKRFLSSRADQLDLCLNLLPVTNYTISITALSAKFTTVATANTSLQAPRAPVISYEEFETPSPVLRLYRSPSTLDPISLYQVFVLSIEGTLVFDCSAPGSPDFSNKRKYQAQYVAAQFHVRDVGKEMNFTVGDGLYYDGFYNAPLEHGKDYYIILRAVSQWKRAFKGSCVLWAKVRGTSYVMKVSSLAAAGIIGLIALVVFGGYIYIWFFKKA